MIEAISVFWAEYGDVLLDGLADTAVMVSLSTVFAYVLGLPLGVLLVTTRADGITRILYQSQFPASAVEIIARDLNATSVAIDPLREDVLANIAEITDQITARP